MKKNLTAILVVVIVALVSILVVGSNANNLKIKNAQAQIVSLTDIVAMKDAELAKLSDDVKAKQQEVDALKKEIEGVKTELSNTVIKLQGTVPVKN